MGGSPGLGVMGRDCCVNAPFKQICNFILYFVSLLLTSPYFRSLLEYSAYFCSLQFTSSFWPNLPKNVPDYSSNVTFYWRAMSDSRMFIVPILTWSIRNTSSVNWNLLVCRVATIHKKTCVPKVVVLNTGTIYWMDIFHVYLL